MSGGKSVRTYYSPSNETYELLIVFDLCRLCCIKQIIKQKENKMYKRIKILLTDIKYGQNVEEIMIEFVNSVDCIDTTKIKKLFIEINKICNELNQEEIFTNKDLEEINNCIKRLRMEMLDSAMKML